MASMAHRNKKDVHGLGSDQRMFCVVNGREKLFLFTSSSIQDDAKRTAKNRKRQNK